MDALLDTPKRKSLQDQATQLRLDLKEFEKTFAAEHNGQKPGKEDIKANVDIAAKYKHYNKVREVLAGKVGVQTLSVVSPCRRKRHERKDSVVSFSATERHDARTPRKTRVHPAELDPYDAIPSVSPKAVFRSAVEPTPQRDGKVLGLFDLLSNSGSKRNVMNTPSSNKKRKIDVLAQDDSGLAVVQTPNQRSKRSGDVLEHLAGDTPKSAAATGRRKHGKTPTSDGKKFMLSQFFATPTAVRYAGVLDGKENETPGKTPLRSWVMNATPEKLPESDAPHDSTPAYLKRSFSFKERLLSASSPNLQSQHHEAETQRSDNRALQCQGRTVRRYKSAHKPLSQIAAALRKKEDGEHDDDLEAMRELEDNDLDVSIGDSQNAAGSDDPAVQNVPQKSWKKKGQKRTTRRTTMRPTTMKPTEPPKFISVEEQAPAMVTRVEESQLAPAGARTREYESSEDELAALEDIVEPHRAEYLPELSDRDFDHDEESDASHDDLFDQKSTKRVKEKEKPKLDLPPRTKKAISKKEKPGTINPNAQSHMNFRSLKIKNKNSKAKGTGGGRFGGKRR